MYTLHISYTALGVLESMKKASTQKKIYYTMQKKLDGYRDEFKMAHFGNFAHFVSTSKGGGIMRFKTEGEFLAEFGVGWRKIYSTWPKKMDHLLGTTLEKADEARVIHVLHEIRNISITKATNQVTKFITHIEGFGVGSWMIRQEESTTLASALKNLYGTYGYTEVALNVLLAAREES